MADAPQSPVLVSAVRTPIGAFGGALSTVAAADLGGHAITGALAAAGLDANAPDQAVMGHVLQAATGLNPARHAAFAADLPAATPAYTVNLACGSGLKAVALAADAVRLGTAQVVVAGGMENMSAAPYLLPKARWGQRLGHGELVDSVLLNGLWDSHVDCHMGDTAENLAAEYGISRAEQDAFALTSQHRCEAAQAAGRFADEIVAVPVPQRKGEPQSGSCGRPSARTAQSLPATPRASTTAQQRSW
jgi:acetyl-CoA C-acetyltransferase